MEQKASMVALDLYHTVLYRAPCPALRLELLSKLFQLRLIAGQAGNYRDAFPFAAFRFPSDPHHRIASGNDFFPAAYTFSGRPAALGTHPPVGGRVDDALSRFFHGLAALFRPSRSSIRMPVFLDRKVVEIGDLESISITIIADLVLKANPDGYAVRGNASRKVVPCIECGDISPVP